MVEAAGQYPIADNNRRGLHAVFALEFPNHAAVASVQAIDVTVCGRKVNAIAANRRLSRPGCAAPRIFVQPAPDTSGFHGPGNSQLAVFPWTSTLETTFSIPEPNHDR